MDADASGEIEYKELNQTLRRRVDDPSHSDLMASTMSLKRDLSRSSAASLRASPKAEPTAGRAASAAPWRDPAIVKLLSK